MNTNDKKSGRMIKTAFLMVLITLSAKALGMVRDILLASAYGTSPEAVAFDTASRLPLIIFDFVIGGVITASFIPVFNELLIKKGKKDALGFAVCYVNLIFIITTIIAIVGVAFSEVLVGWLAPDIPDSTAMMAASLAKIMFPMIIFTGLAFSFVGLLQSFENFLLPAVISLVSNLIMVLYFVFLNNRFGIWGLAFAMLIGWGAQALIQLPAVLGKGFRFKPTLDLSSPYLRKAFKMALPILISSWVQPFCNLINTRYASSFEGGISAMGYANRLYLIIVGVFTFVATNLLFPYFSKAEAEGDSAGGEKLTRNSIKALMLVILPITFGIFALSEPFIALIYQRNQFTYADTVMTAEAFRFFALGMPFYAISEVCTKKFFAEQKTAVPMITALVSIAFNFAFVYLLSEKMGIAGIALSSSIAVAVNCALNVYMRYRGGDKLLAMRDVFSIAIMLFSAYLMGILAYYLSFALSGAAGLVLNIIICALVYFIACFAFGESIVRETVFKILKTKRRD